MARLLTQPPVLLGARFHWPRAQVTALGTRAGRTSPPSGSRREEERELGALRALCTPQIQRWILGGGEMGNCPRVWATQDTCSFHLEAGICTSGLFWECFCAKCLLGSLLLGFGNTETAPPTRKALLSLCFSSRVNSCFLWPDLSFGEGWRAFWNEFHQPWVCLHRPDCQSVAVSSAFSAEAGIWCFSVEVTPTQPRHLVTWWDTRHVSQEDTGRPSPDL